MRFLIDQCLSPLVAEGLCDRGFDAIHVDRLGFALESDQAILEHARQEGRLVLTADTDFGDLLAMNRHTSPSVLLFRDGAATATEVLHFLDHNLAQLKPHLEAGAIAVVRESRIRIRRLPLL